MTMRRFVHFGMGSRLIRINKWSATGDPFEEFPNGNSLWPLEGAFVFPCWLHAADTVCHGRWLILKPPAQIAMASARSLEQRDLALRRCRDSVRFRLPRCGVRHYFSAIGNRGLFV